MSDVLVNEDATLYYMYVTAEVIWANLFFSEDNLRSIPSWEYTPRKEVDCPFESVADVVAEIH